MDVDELLAKANDSISVSRVYGPPIESGGAIIIPAARVAGGGGGSGGDESGNQGSGTGHGVMARPAGAIREETSHGSRQWTSTRSCSVCR